MSRRHRAEKRAILPDAKYGDKVVTKFINNVMEHGKKAVAEKIVYSAFDIIAAKSKQDALKVFSDALENVIKALRPHTLNRLHVLFGCGGDRDAGKRPIMGKIANDMADVVYVTDDNPRTEDATKIRGQIMATCPKGQNIPDRAQAIRQAISNLKAGDSLILAGKGHETGQYVKGKIIPFSDQEEALKSLASL